MTKTATRQEYSYEPKTKRFVFVRRGAPWEKAEICFGDGFHECEAIKLEPDQLRALARDIPPLYFTSQVKA